MFRIYKKNPHQKRPQKAKCLQNKNMTLRFRFLSIYLQNFLINYISENQNSSFCVKNSAFFRKNITTFSTRNVFLVNFTSFLFNITKEIIQIMITYSCKLMHALKYLFLFVPQKCTKKNFQFGAIEINFFSLITRLNNFSHHVKSENFFRRIIKSFNASLCFFFEKAQITPSQSVHESFCGCMIPKFIIIRSRACGIVCWKYSCNFSLIRPLTSSRGHKIF